MDEKKKQHKGGRRLMRPPGTYITRSVRLPQVMMSRLDMLAAAESIPGRVVSANVLIEEAVAQYLIRNRGRIDQAARRMVQ